MAGGKLQAGMCGERKAESGERRCRCAGSAVMGAKRIICHRSIDQYASVDRNFMVVSFRESRDAAWCG